MNNYSLRLIRSCIWIVSCVLLVQACSSDGGLTTNDGAVDHGSGSGGKGVGGAPGTGGANVTGTGGIVGAGGIIGTGGIVGTGGVVGTGGGADGAVTGTGGIVGTGGDADAAVVGTGGVMGTGGDADAAVTGTGGDMDAAVTGTGGEMGTGGTCDPGAPTGFTTNYVTNTDFESGTTGWTGLYGATLVSSSMAHCGTMSAEAMRTQAYHGIRYDLSTTAAGTYMVSVWITHDASVAIQMGVQLACTMDADGGTTLSYNNISFLMVQPGVWTHVSGTGTVPAGCSSLFLQIVQNGSTPDGGTPALPDLFVDDAYIVQ
jgi:hypothetical protein